ARQKRVKGGLVVFDCLVRSNGQELVSGTVTVRAPEHRLQYSEVATPQVLLRRNDKYAKLMKKCQGIPAVSCAVAYPCDRDSLLGPIEAAKLGLIGPVLVGPEDKIRAVAKAEDVDLTAYRIVPTENSVASAEKAVALVRGGEAE